MRVLRREKKNKKKLRIEKKKAAFRPWEAKSKKYSEYPYVVTVSFFRRNVFISASDLRGRIKFWTNAGRLNFKGKDKIQYLAVVEIARRFFKMLLRYGIRDIFLKFNNYKRARPAIRKAIRILKLNGKRDRRKKPKNILVNRWRWQKVKGKRVKMLCAVMVKNQPRKNKTTTYRKLRFLGIWTELHVSFNGCRNKKQRRKRSRRRAKRIRLR